ncbi:hypothetical protein MTR_6g029210 [Medicago truncatula]|uniref:Uncharacterized protein n=1 Tax=Medicago truncatula TaxID=3880 RepID=G7KPL0_MEDTR|nr:hypothetical protein MTR_6g029210 [Medicago truncatula]
MIKKWNGERKMKKRQKKGRKINEREKLNHDKVISGREGDETEMSRKSMGIKVAMTINKSQSISSNTNILIWSIICCNFKSDLKKRFEDIINKEDGGDDTVTSNVLYRQVFRNV